MSTTTVEDFDEELNLYEDESEEEISDEGMEEASLEGEEHEVDLVTPSHLDVLLGKDKRSFNHSGNTCFRHVISTSIPAYHCAPNRARKSEIIREIVGTITRAGGRFLRSANEKKSHDEPGMRWKVVEPKQAREKVGHAIRDALNTRARQNLPIPDGVYESSFDWTSLIEMELAQRVAYGQDPRKDRLKGAAKVNATNRCEDNDFPEIDLSWFSSTTEESAPVTPLKKRKTLSDSSIIPNETLSSNKMPKRVSTDLSARYSPTDMYDRSWMPKKGTPDPAKKPLLDLPQILADVLSNTCTPKQASPTRLVTPSHEGFLDGVAAAESKQPRAPSPFVKAVASPAHHSITSSSEEEDEKSVDIPSCDIYQILLEVTSHDARPMHDHHHGGQVESPSLSRIASTDSLFDEAHRSISPLPFHHHSEHVPHYDDVPMWEYVATELKDWNAV